MKMSPLYLCLNAFILQVVLSMVSAANTCSLCNRGALRCQKISGIYTVKYLSQGYHPVVDIPAGACNINITELKNSRNYLAIKSSTGHWILNGHWRKNKPGLYHGVGTQFRYDRDSARCPSECIWGHGPLQRKITVQLMYGWTNEGIIYEFTLPPNVEYSSPTNLVHAGRTVHRRRHHHQHRSGHSNYGDTSRNSYSPSLPSHSSNITHNSFLGTSRRYGESEVPSSSQYTGSSVRLRQRPQTNIRYRPRPRYVSPGDTGSDYQAQRAGSRGVRYGLPPSISEDNTKEISNQGNEGTSFNLQIPTGPGSSVVLQSQYSWRISGFTQCTHSCGTGTQETQVVCILKATQVQVTDDNCDISLRPLIQTVSCNTSPCPPQWEVNPWSACSVTCGRGTQARRIECKRRISEEEQISVSASLCDDRQKPAIMQQCENDPCAHWRTGNWSQCSVHCGSGERKRTVQCVDTGGVPVREELCDTPTPRRTETCSMGTCEYHWFFSQWSNECSSSCGSGIESRSVHCATVSGERASDRNCDLDTKPQTQQQCQDSSRTGHCGNKWFTGPWSQCSTSCGEGVRSRPVLCIEMDSNTNSRIVSQDQCNNSTRPMSQESCLQSTCGAQWHMSEWTQCPVTCGGGQVTRSVVCLDDNLQPVTGCDSATRPSSREVCNQQECVSSISDTDPSCKDRYRNCPLVVQARLCRYDYYRQICCSSCYHEQKVN